MHEVEIPLSRLAAYSLWALTILLLIGGWGAYTAHLADMAIMLATSACVTGLGASTLTIRCYARHVSRLVRLAGGLPYRGRSDVGVGLRSINDRS